MSAGPASTPPDFVSYVERRLPAVEYAARRLTGDETAARALAEDLLARVAARWGRLSRKDGRADAYLLKLFHYEEVEAGGYGGELDLTRQPPPSQARSLATRDALTAELIWDRGRGWRRRRLLVTAAIAAVAGLVALCSRGRSQPGSPTEVLPTLRTTPDLADLPEGADLAPAAAVQTYLARLAVVGIPDQLDFEELAGLPALSARPVRRAVALIAPDGMADSPVFARGDDGAWRRVDAAPDHAGLWMESGALSPDGTHAAFGSTGSAIAVVDLTTGTASSYPVADRTLAPVWLDSKRLVVGRGSVLDLATEKVIAAAIDPGGVAANRRPDPADPADEVIELVALGSGDPAVQVRQWVPGTAEKTRTLGLSGDLADLVGSWSGPAFAIDGERGWVVRACVPRVTGSGNRPTIAAVALRPSTGEVGRVLLVAEPTAGSLRLLGWAGGAQVLLRLAQPTRQKVLTWDVGTGALSLISVVRLAGALSLPDVTSVLA